VSRSSMVIADGEPGAMAGCRTGEAVGEGPGEDVGVRSPSTDARGGARRPEEKRDEYWAARRVSKDMLVDANASVDTFASDHLRRRCGRDAGSMAEVG
jgi:hypothetical protein